MRNPVNSIADQLPPEIARQIHPDRRKNEAAYWAARDQLLNQYRDQWIGFADGKVIASGDSPVTVFHAAEGSGRHPFFICVGREDEPCRIRAIHDGSAIPSSQRMKPMDDNGFIREFRRLQMPCWTDTSP
jgi:hypothetical protein